MAVPDEFFPTYGPIPYDPGGNPGTQQYFSVFLPQGRRPSTLWPVVLDTDYGGWTVGHVAKKYTRTGNGESFGSGLQRSGLPWLLLAEGICAVASFSMTTVDLQPVPTTPGRGTFKPPTHADWTQRFAETDLLRCVSAVRNRAHEFELDAEMLGGNGASAGSPLYALLNQNYAGGAGQWGSGSTRLQFAIAGIFQGLFNAIDNNNALFFHFPNGVDHNDIAITLGMADATYKEMASPLRYGFDPTIAGAGNILALNKDTRLYMTVGVPAPLGGDFAASPPGLLYMSKTPAATAWATADYSDLYGKLGDGGGGGGHGTDPYHNSWHAYALKEKALRNGWRFAPTGGLSRLVVSQAAKALGSWKAADPREDAVMDMDDLSALGDDAQAKAAWVREVLKSL